MGHLYLREWIRAILWFGLLLTASTLLIPEGAIPDQPSLNALLAASRAVPTYAAIAMLSLTMLSMLDAYSMARRYNEPGVGIAADGTVRCPSCGHELEDPSIGFCPWCAQELNES